MTEVSLFERLKFWGWRISVVSIVGFFIVVGLSLVFGLGINGISNLSVISLALLGLAVVFVVGFTLDIYGSIRIWLRGRRAA